MKEGENGEVRYSPEEPLGGWDEEVTQGGHSLDEVARGLATGALSRRKALKMAAGAFLGGMLGVFSIMNPAHAKRRRRRLRCIPGAVVPGGNDCPGKPGAFPCLIRLDNGTSGCCLPQNICTAVAGAVAALDCLCQGPLPPPGQQCQTNADCTPPQICVNGTCQAPPPPPACTASPCPAGQCCNPEPNPDVCVEDCPGGTICISDVCQPPAPDNCPGECPANAPNCNPATGQCVKDCPAGSVAILNICTPTSVLPNVCPNTDCPDDQCINPVTCECVAPNQCPNPGCCFDLEPFTRGAGVCVQGCSAGQNCNASFCRP